MEVRRRKLAIWGRNNELLELNRGEQRKKRVSAREEEGREEGVYDLATSLAAGRRGKVLRQLAHGVEELWEDSSPHTELC